MVGGLVACVVGVVGGVVATVGGGVGGTVGVVPTVVRDGVVVAPGAVGRDPVVTVTPPPVTSSSLEGTTAAVVAVVAGSDDVVSSGAVEGARVGGAVVARTEAEVVDDDEVGVRGFAPTLFCWLMLVRLLLNLSTAAKTTAVAPAVPASHKAIRKSRLRTVNHPTRRPTPRVSRTHEGCAGVPFRSPLHAERGQIP